MNGAYTKLGTSLADLRAAWQDRLTDAESLLAAGRPAWAIATALYALEIRLKVSICKRLDLEQLPKQFEIHDLPGLLLLAGLSRRIQRPAAKLVKMNWDALVAASKSLNEIRYTPDSQHTAAEADQLFHQLRGEPNGVLPWLDRVR